ncbi:MAG: hypothetical protein K2M64_04495 [Clostridia bacterium]|nr:hypothetical protein [Clostridia bacterium]
MAIIIEGSGYNETYEVNSWGDITKHGFRTDFKLRGNDICLSSNSRTIGWLRSGGTVDYANDYNGNKPFRRWKNG